jgi:hypothetical protein
MSDMLDDTQLGANPTHGGTESENVILTFPHIQASFNSQILGLVL